MDTKAFYFRVGLFVFSLFVAIILFLLWLGGRSLDDDRLPYDIYFPGSISGLIVGSPVKYKGLTVGNVGEMTIPKDNVEVIKIRILVDPEIQVKEDSMAQLQMQGITGGSFVQITGGSNEAKNIQTSKRNVGVIPTSPSSFDSLTQNLPVLMNNLTELTSRMNSVLSDDNIIELTDMFISFNKTAQKAEKAVTTLDQMLAENKKPIRNFTNNTLVDISGLINDMREMSKTITQTAENIDKNKADFFFGSPDHKGVKID